MFDSEKDRKYNLGIYLDGYHNYLDWILNEIARQGKIITTNGHAFNLINLEDGSITEYNRASLVVDLVHSFKEKWDFAATKGPFYDAIEYICKNPKDFVERIHAKWEPQS